MSLPPKANWYIAAKSDQLSKGQVIPRTILNDKIVLFRGSDGQVRALTDKCPHKHVPLSIGVVQGNDIACKYHGWKFSGEGVLTDIPCIGESEKLMKCRIQKYPIIEQDDWIWIWMDENQTPETSPPSYPKDKKYYWFELHNIFQAPIDTILENGLDCSHTGFVHEGLFRSKPETFVEAQIETKSSGVRVQTTGEKTSHKRDVRAILSGGNEITHFDEFFGPHTIKVDYFMGRSHVVTILVCTPETEKSTRVYTRMASYFPYFNLLIGVFIKSTTKKVVEQDKILLEAQATNVTLGKRDGFKYSSADIPTRSFYASFDNFCTNKTHEHENKKINTRYKL